MRTCDCCDGSCEKDQNKKDAACGGVVSVRSLNDSEKLFKTMNCFDLNNTLPILIEITWFYFFRLLVDLQLLTLDQTFWASIMFCGVYIRWIREHFLRIICVRIGILFQQFVTTRDPLGYVRLVINTRLGCGITASGEIGTLRGYKHFITLQFKRLDPLPLRAPPPLYGTPH